jgi:superfamily II DNA or RNA helicase
MQDFKTINFPITSQYSSDSEHIPLEFFEDAIPKAKTMDMVLGYFSTNAIKTLCLGFSEFIYFGGTLRIVTNHQLTQEDKHNLLSEPELKNENQIIDIFKDLRLLKDELGPFGQHFFDCLKFLLKRNRLVILPVMHKPNAMAHYKKIILFDGENHLYVSGSANFTGAGIIKNGESFIVDKSWGSETEKERIKEEIKNFDSIFSKQHPSFDYLKPEQVIGIIQHIGNDLTELELLAKTSEMTGYFSGSVKIKKVIDRRTIEFQNLIDETEKKPRFPFIEGPRAYQIEAYNNWVKNNHQGVFAMATGTGKTITSLNCLLREYFINQEKTYHAIIIVPTISLVEQWAKEAKMFNLTSIIKVNSKTKWESDLATTLSTAKRISISFIIITTYASFIKDRFFNEIKKFPEDTILIADEAHNIGAPTVLERLSNFPFKKRIGLSATPKRAYDIEGSTGMETFFNDMEPYTYSFSMKKAIEEGILCKYNYHPHIVHLTNEELTEYVEISKKLARLFNKISEQFNSPEIAEMLLLKRKRIIHKAENKLIKTVSILKERYDKEGSLKYTFIYVPEGTTVDDTQNIAEELDGIDTIKIINQYTRAIGQLSPNIKVNQFVSGMRDRDEILQQFKLGKIDVIASMKCLDEGIDIPRAEHAIFCSSTGNPRQFIQRRGRILRKHADKNMATIHDLVVIPDLTCSHESSETFNLERNMVQKELERVMNFASLAINPFETEAVFEEICTHYNLNIYTIHQNLKL